jgi:hypothetical protein
LTTNRIPNSKLPFHMHCMYLPQITISLKNTINTHQLKPQTAQVIQLATSFQHKKLIKSEE